MEKKIKTKNKQSIGYQGKITVKLTDGKRIIKTRTYHNNGTTKLFQYLCSCLAGYAEDSNNARPTRIMLFTLAIGETETEFRKDFFEETYSASPFIPYLATPALTKGAEGSEDLYNITYNFRIPYQRIKTNSGIYKAALYNNIPDGTVDMLAWFKFIDDAGQWAPIEVDKDTNYSIIIEWTMTISNK